MLEANATCLSSKRKQSVESGSAAEVYNSLKKRQMGIELNNELKKVVGVFRKLWLRNKQTKYRNSDLDLDLDFDFEFERDLDFDFERDLDFDLEFERDLDFDFERDLDFDFECDLDFDLELLLARDLSYDSDFSRETRGDFDYKVFRVSENLLLSGTLISVYQKLTKQNSDDFLLVLRRNQW